jgi:general secretion pathway protein N
LHGFGQLDPQLQQLAFSLPADALGKLSPLLMPLGLQGRIIVECPHFDFNAQGWHGTLQARLEQVQSSLSPVKPLGDYQLTFIADGQKATLAVQTLQGALQLQGAGQLTLVPDTARRFSITRPAMPSALTISGLASTDSEHQQALQALLRVLGNPLDQTRFSWGYTWQAA